ncbi:hypothetical protein HNY73_001432 [Argiope bruennichi]|uniref:Uncharacterized protein n=1 Tax=Argiope bruennichi TaxID=94029 RepID=A0A8T0G5H4_ARGBR|nr:hypothetical protein HNY73_001432 [Argiope bruennichi]
MPSPIDYFFSPAWLLSDPCNKNNSRTDSFLQGKNRQAMVISGALFNNNISCPIAARPNPAGPIPRRGLSFELFGGRFLEKGTSYPGINVIATTHNEITENGVDNSISDGSIISFWMPARTSSGGALILQN